MKLIWLGIQGSLINSIQPHGINPIILIKEVHFVFIIIIYFFYMCT